MMGWLRRFLTAFDQGMAEADARPVTYYVQPQHDSMQPTLTSRQIDEAQAQGWHHAAQHGHGANGTASHATFPVGSAWSESVRTHPSTGRQMATDRFNHGQYAGTYSNRGVYTWDPDGRTVYGD